MQRLALFALMVWLGGFLPAGVLLSQSPQQQKIPRESQINSFAQMDSLIHSREILLQNDPANLALKISLAQLYFRKGAWKEAERLANDILAARPGDVEAQFTLGKVYQKTYRLFAAEELFERLEAAAPGNIEIKIARCELLILKEDFKAARKKVKALLKIAPASPDALCLQAALDYIEGRDEAAEGLYRKALELDPQNSRASAGLGRMYVNKFHYQPARENLEKALQDDFFNAEAHASLGYVYFKSGKLSEAGRELRLALRCDEYNAYAHKLYGRGVTDRDYAAYPAPEDLKVENALLWEQLNRAQSLADSGRREEAKRAYYTILAADSQNVRAGLGLGSLYWLAGRPDSALAAFQKVLQIYPDYGLAHNGVFCALAMMVDEFSSDRPGSPGKSPQGEPSVADLAALFRNYAALPEPFRRSVQVSVSPLSPYLPALKEAGATFYLLPLDEKLTDDSARKFLAGTRTFDLRLWDDIRGNGGLNATACISSVWDALHSRFNELAHEFAHQAHIYAFTEAEKERIKTLFNAALGEKRCLDDYAESDEFEYFAVGYEAYISPAKKPYLRGYHGHTRGELKRKDPRLYALIEEFTRKKDARENLLAGKIARAEQFIYAGRIERAVETCQEVLEAAPGYLPALNAWGYALLAQDSLDGAIRLLQEAVERPPARPNGGAGQASPQSWLLLGRALYARDGDLAQSLAIYRQGIAQHPRAAQLHLEAGKCLEISGQLPEARRSYEKALQFDPNLYPARIRLAACQRQLGYLAQADTLLGAALAKKKSAPAYLEYASLLIQQSRFEQAGENLRMAIELDPQNRDARGESAALRCRTGEASEGASILQELLETGKDKLKVWNDLLACLIESGDHAEAGRCLAGAESLLAAPRKREKVGDWENIYQSTPAAGEIARLYFLKGRLLSRAGQKAEAVAALEASVSAMPYFFDAYPELTKSLRESGEEEKAKQYSQKMLDLHPGPRYRQ